MLGGRVFGGSREEPRLSQLKKRRSEDRRRPTVDGKSPTGSEPLRRRRTSRFRSYHLPRPIFLPSFQSQRAERDSRDRDREETATGASCSISCNCIDKFPIKKQNRTLESVLSLLSQYGLDHPIASMSSESASQVSSNVETSSAKSPRSFITD